MRPNVSAIAVLVCRQRVSSPPLVALAVGLARLKSPAVTVRTARFNIQQFYVLPTQCVYVFCVDLRTNSDYFPIQH
jgi:hypothetical protein